MFENLLHNYVDAFATSIQLVIKSSFIWFPLTMVYMFWERWMLYVRGLYLYKLDWVMLDIKLPQDVFKSPLAMETFLMSLHQTGGEGTFIDRNWKGKVRPFFSLEIASIEGKVKFFIRTEKRFRKFIELNLYAHYPNIEIHEAVDYSMSAHFDLKEMDLYVTNFKLKEPDPYPIKTYVDYGIENESVKEEMKVDPLNSVLEYMGSVGPNQQFWLQFIIRAHKKETRKPGAWPWEDKTDSWKDEAKVQIEKIRQAAIPKSDDPLVVKFPNPTKGEQEKIAALDRSVSKIPFDTVIRAIYIGKKDFFDGTHIPGVRTLLQSFSSPALNSFAAESPLDGFDYPWQDMWFRKRNSRKKDGLEEYKRRAGFYKPFNSTVIVLNVEELATVFHLPGKVATTPSLDRIPSKKSEAPSNLPI